MDAKPKCLFILGPTASGKTDLAIDIAKQLPSRLISVDSALIYRDMDIGTAKPDVETLKAYPHDLVNIIDPDQNYSVARFIEDAKRSIEEAIAEQRLPILVGGTMLYFKGLIDGLSDLPEADLAVRKKIEEMAVEKGWPALHAELANLDPKAAERIDPNHSQRISRALEVCYSSGSSLTELLSKSKGEKYSSITEKYDVRQIGLSVDDRSLLHQRINQRFEIMLDEGFIDEVKMLRDKYSINLDHASMRCVGYRQVWQYLEGDFDREEMISRAQAATRQLAKRQFTWMRSWSDLNLLPVSWSQEVPSKGNTLLNDSLNYLKK